MAQYLTSVNPYNSEIVNKYPVDDNVAVDQKIAKAAAAFDKWGNTSQRQRAAYLKSIADNLLKNKHELAKTATEEMGKPIAQSLAEIEKSAWSLKYYAENGERFLNDEIIETEAQKSYVTYQPLGVVLAIMPWNFPYWQVFRAMGPILMAGNTMLLKHASNVTGCAIAIQKIVAGADLPADIFQTLVIPSSMVEPVIANPVVKAITFTGSTTVGAQVAATAASHLKKQVLELGGSDPYVILADADLPKAVELCVQSRMNNTGQSCIAAKRFIVVKDVVEVFTMEFVKQIQTRMYGDPMDAASLAGPMARTDLRDELHQQVLKSVEKGASLLCGGAVPEGNGAFYPPTVLGNVSKGMPAYNEELFGPVASIITAEDEEDAIRIANDTAFGLGGAVFSRDVERAEKIAATRIQSGSVFVNSYVSSDPRLPFGGINQSGYGRELSYFAVREFVNIKTISIK